jgi:hypothetical protein
MEDIAIVTGTKKTTNITGGALPVGDDKNTGNDSKVTVKQSLLS